jgi:hypothetical protein
VGLRGWVRRLERAAQGEALEIPQKDGTVKRFPQSAGMEAFANLMERMGAGDDAPPEHPLLTAARDSSSPEWSESIYSTEGEAWTEAIEDLSE